MTAADRYFAACHALNRDEWAPGMRWLRWAPGTARHLQIAGRVPDGPDMHDYDRDHVVPDFTDPATVGVLLAAVREAWACPTLSAAWCFVPHPGGDWFVPRIPADAYGDTEADALIAALEAAAARRGGQP
jgi:hypothetical protein